MRLMGKWGVLIRVPLLLLAAAAWAGAAAEEAQQQELAQTLRELAANVQHVKEQVLTLSKATGQLEGRIRTMEGLSDRLLLDASRVGPSRAQFLPDPPSGMVTVQLLAEAVNDGVPGRFRFYMAAPEAARLYMTESLPRGQPVPKGQELKDGVAFVKPGKFYTLQVVYENPTDQEVKFLVTGGIVDPQAALPFVRNRCWCAAIPFSAPAGGTFYRTIQVGVGPDTPAGAKAVVIWPVVALKQ